MEYQNYLSLLYEENQKRGCPCISPETGEFLHFLVQALKAQRILEIGTCLGYSTLWLSKDFKGTVTTLEKNCLSFEEVQKHFLIVADNITSHADLVQDYVTHMEKNYQSVLVPVGSGLLLSVQR